MNAKSLSAELITLGRNMNEAPDHLPCCDGSKLAEFILLLGKTGARDWLDAFRSGLALEFAAPGAAPTENSRADIHHICARSGLIGFDALHQACLDFLETRPEQGNVEAAYRRLRSQAERACAELARQCVLLS